MLLGTAGIARASSAAEATAAVRCPEQGQRFQLGSDKRVYLLSSNNYVHSFPNEQAYFSLWDTWDGIANFPTSIRVDCFGVFSPHSMEYTGLYKTASRPEIYIWDYAMGAYRWIRSEAVFNKYAFSWAKVRTVNSIGSTGLIWY
jgi:hypothetical protein